MNKIKLKDSIVKWSSYELDGGLVDAISKLQKLIADNPNHFDFSIELETESGYYNECSTNIIIDAYRWETDEETSKRIELSKRKSEAAKLAAARQAEANEKRERSLYESLKRKFEKELNEGQSNNQ